MKNIKLLGIAVLGFSLVGCATTTVTKSISADQVATQVVSSTMGPELVDYQGPDTTGIGANRPFPQNVAYAGVITPNHKSAGELNGDVVRFYEKWKTAYLKNYPGTGVVYIKGEQTGDLPEGWPTDVVGVSTSEATGYGLLIFALMAGQDPMAKSYFDGLLELVMNNQSVSGGNSHAPMMSWVVPSRFDPDLEKVDGAADGDLDIAYALLLADKQWGSKVPEGATVVKSTSVKQGDHLLFGAAATDYMGLAKRHMAGIRQYLVDDGSHRILMGDWAVGLDGGIGQGAAHRFNSSATRPSDWMLDHLRAFNLVDPNEEWQGAIDEINKMFQTVPGEKTGFFPDFVEDVDGVAQKVVLDVPFTDEHGKAGKMYLESAYDDAYYWNACRVPWRLAVDAVHFGSGSTIEMLQRLNAFTTANIGSGPSDFADAIWHGYTLEGAKITPDDDWRTSLAFTAPLVSALMVDAKYQAHLNHGWDFINDNFLGDHTEEEGFSGYFADSIALLNLLLISGNWWNPVQ